MSKESKSVTPDKTGQQIQSKDRPVTTPGAKATLEVKPAPKPPADAKVEAAKAAQKKEMFAPATTGKQSSELITLAEAVSRILNDPRYRSSWEVSVAKHAKTFGMGDLNTQEEWLSVFKSYGLTVKE
ncbi:hypothetical protein UFOVP244_17 [uncultured Caudovirales phage]|uniref:Uncharacterized protein n=1 Tax=uncultured Caudovirales phage TaxID=2100421 RepID=A0A6J7WS61_9CAUD|nr:hypothetical protein UFOVP244_17 [uncultured Caudovirales phage]